MVNIQGRTHNSEWSHSRAKEVTDPRLLGLVVGYFSSILVGKRLWRRQELLAAESPQRLWDKGREQTPLLPTPNFILINS